ncbi:MAG TPA: CHASE2 domain-containing protein [Bacteroidota bacterium]|nr:CHASE2 domain-containing protein [Bacteroidota bacterium]
MTLYDFKKKYFPVLIKLGISTGIGLFVVLFTHFFEIDFLSKIDLLTVDYRFQSRYETDGPLKDLMRAGDVVIVSISDEDGKALPVPFPFPRSYYAHIIENLNRAGAAVIAIDITFTTPREGDDTLRAVLQKYNNVVLAVKAEEDVSRGLYEIRSLDQNFNNVFFDVNKNIGVVNVLKDRDDVVRRYTPLFKIQDNLVPTLGVAAVARRFGLAPMSRVEVTDEAFLLKDRAIPKFDERTFMLNYYGPVQTFRYVPFSQVVDDERFWTKDELELQEEINTFDENMMKLFKGKIVFIGSTMAEERDYHSVSVANPADGSTIMHGVEIHATAAQMILDNAFVYRADPTIEVSLIIGLSILIFFVVLWFKQIKLRYTFITEIGAVIIVLLFVIAVAEVALLAFSSANVLLNFINPGVAIVLSYFGTAVYQYLTERQQKALIKNVFSHYISAAVVNELVANPDKAKLGGDRRELSVFFSDIAGFTSISERFHNHPEGLVELLNEYLDEMTAIVLKFGGTLDKYEGDAIMAFWGAPIPQKDHALRTCLAALDMQRRLAELRPKWKKAGKPELDVRCGINTGIMIVGNMGGKDRFDYTVIGDSVNLASRLEGANKQYGSHIMISEFTYNHVKSKMLVRELDLIQVKGKTEPVKVFELLGPTDMEMTENQKQANEIYHEGLKLYRDRKWEEAIAYFNQAYQLDPNCHVAHIYAERAQLYQINPPPEDWNGVFVMMTK